MPLRRFSVFVMQGLIALAGERYWRITMSPRLENLQPWADYWPAKPLIFSTKHVAQHFLDTRRERMRELGILFQITRGFLVDRELLDQHLLALLATADGYPREEAAA